jgi:hypothetical protein
MCCSDFGGCIGIRKAQKLLKNDSVTVTAKTAEKQVTRRSQMKTF